MPITIATYRDETDALVETEYWDVGEVSDLIHVSRSTIYRKLREGVWPCVRLGAKPYMSAWMIGAAVDQMTQRVGEIPQDPPRLGTPVAPAEIEPVR
jgi:predicted DNA-binding transcriptional regulator AlpA